MVALLRSDRSKATMLRSAGGRSCTGEGDGVSEETAAARAAGPADAARVTVYTRIGCPACAKAEDDVARICGELGETWQAVDVDYTDEEIVYRVKKPKHVGLIFFSEKQERVSELLDVYAERIKNDFLAVAPAKERYDD